MNSAHRLQKSLGEPQLINTNKVHRAGGIPKGGQTLPLKAFNVVGKEVPNQYPERNM